MFELGICVITPGAQDAIDDIGESGYLLAMELLARHQSCDWGIVSEDDKALNDEAVQNGSRVLSAYLLPVSSTKVWVITEADRSSTTILLPDEY